MATKYATRRVASGVAAGEGEDQDLQNPKIAKQFILSILPATYIHRIVRLLCR